jgi:prevent-host-death family protein
MSVTARDSHWQIQEAKQRFSELIRSVQADGPQFVTKHGEEIAVVIDIEEYRRIHPGERKLSFKEHLLSGPTFDDDFIDFAFERSDAYARDVDFLLEDG